MQVINDPAQNNPTRSQGAVTNGPGKRKLNIRGGKFRASNVAQSTQYTPCLKQLGQFFTHISQTPMEQPAKKPSNRHYAPGTARTHKELEERIIESDAP